MKRLIGFLSVVAVLVAVSMSHFASADPPERKLVCHHTSSFTDANGNTIFTGRVISLPDNNGMSFEQHLAHGDIELSSGSAGDCCAFCKDINGDTCRIRID